MIQEQITKLVSILGAGGLNGAISVAALTGLFRPENAFLIAILFMAGPGAILTAALFEGKILERMFTALLAGITSTIIVILSAGIGPKLLAFTNLGVLKIVGGISILAIGLLIMGIKIPEKIPLLIMIGGIILSFIWR